MHINLKGWLFHSSHFCFCVPVRAGFVLISILTFLLSGAVSVIIWFEVFHSYQLSAKERVAFILAGIVESILFLASTIGFIGVVARKQLFVTIYTYFLYVHFVLNLIVGIYFLVTVRASNREQLVDYCAEVFVNTSTESSCPGLTRVSTYVFMAIVAALLLFEFYGVLIATRYVYRLRKQKRDDRSRRLGYFHALSKPETSSIRHTRQASDDIELLNSRDSTVDPQDLEDIVLDIGPPSYIPVSTYDRDLPPVPAVGSPQSLSGTPPVRRIRALPPRPDMASPVTRAPSRPQEDAAQPRVESEDVPSPIYSAEVSSTAHSALMDHATYIQSVFVRSNPSLR
ncbi:hypothetical protein L210DRAFT_3530161 [Boletus edulis BED1]|uniref:Uncharacterized protein n=1 Tax=Boletus edulis BED1 TaxID=1328754 RepID=A0AAD4BZM8_BOLED|nr:hypothetical protein L210DRAFT_3530161 [Boletus edulis BED1]